MAGQIWAVSTQGQLLYSPLLTKEVVHQAQPLMKFAQFTDMQMEAGKGRGETFLWDKYGNIDTEGGTLTETSTVPQRSYRVYRGTGTLYEWGNSVPFTRKYETLAQAGTRRDPVRVLRNDMAKVIDTAVENQFDGCQIRYVGSSSTAGAFTTNGTATLTCTSQLNRYHVKRIYDYLWNTMYATPWFAEGEEYAGITTQDAMRGLFNDCETVSMYTKMPLTGEWGRYSDVRFVKCSNGMDNTVGDGSAYGEAYIFGADTVKEGVAISPVIIPKEVTDYQRSRGLAWYMLSGYKIFWEADPDNSIVKFDSA